MTSASVSRLRLLLTASAILIGAGVLCWHWTGMASGILLALALALFLTALFQPGSYLPFYRFLNRGVTFAIGCFSWFLLGLIFALIFALIFVPGRAIFALCRRDPFARPPRNASTFWQHPLPHPSGEERYTRQF